MYLTSDGGPNLVRQQHRVEQRLERDFPEMSETIAAADLAKGTGLEKHALQIEELARRFQVLRDQIKK